MSHLPLDCSVVNYLMLLMSHMHRVCANIGNHKSCIAIAIHCIIIVLVVSILITPSAVGIPTAGQAYSLNCSLYFTGVVTYQWFKGQGSNRSRRINTSQLQFSSLRASDAGLYTCQAMVIQNDVEIEETATVIVSRKCFI